MAPNVPSGQREVPTDSCWPWGSEDMDVEMDRDRGPPPPPPLLLTTTTPLAPVTANIIANFSPKSSLKRQTAIVNHKTATAVKIPSKRLKVEHKTGLSNNNNNNNNNTKSSPSPCVVIRQQPQRCCLSHQKNKCVGQVGDADVAALPKVQQQGKITEYFKTQMKPANCTKKDAKMGAAGKGSMESKAGSDTSVGGLDKYFNIISGTQQPYNYPPSKSAGEDEDSPLQMFLWNNKYDVDGISRCAKKNGLVTGTTRKPSSVTTLKIPEIKKNGLANVSSSSSSLSSQKLNLLFMSPPKSVSASNLPECVSYSNKLVRQEKVVVSSVVPKPATSEASANVCSTDSTPPMTAAATAAALSSSTPKLVSEEEEVVVSVLEERSESVQTCETSDTSLSCLVVSVSSSVTSAHSLPSPILSVPRTIRFPAAHCKKTEPLEAVDSIVCRWSECECHFETSTGLLDHLQAKHVSPQVTCENYVCLWVGCKVYARTSCSRSWLERHVLSHGGNKPFCCIVDGCGQRFSSQTTLERHVNGHFNQTEGSTSGTGTRRSMESASSKLFRRNGKKLRYRRQPWSARMFDYFDSGIMEGLQHRLMNMTEKRTQGDIASAPGNTVTLHSKVMGKRVEMDGKTRVLLRWFPENIVDNEWVLESDVTATRNVIISQLPMESSAPLHTVLFNTEPIARHRRPRKPGKPA